MDLSKALLPSSIEIGEGIFFKIHTDFRYWINFSDLLQKDTKLSDFNFLYVGKLPATLTQALEARNKLIEFYSPKKELPHNAGSGDRVIDYKLDADLIYSAFYQTYGIDLFDEDLRLHWHKFLALLSGIDKNSKLSEVIGYRSYNPNDKTDYKGFMLKQQRAWALPAVLSAEEAEALAEFDKKFS